MPNSVDHCYTSFLMAEVEILLCEESVHLY